MINFTSFHKLNNGVAYGDKSISHRALIFASVATGKSVIKNISLCADVLATAECLRTLGATITISGTTAKVLPIERATNGAILNCHNSGTTARLLAGLVAGLGISATFVGDSSLVKRPMDRVLQPLAEMGAKYRKSEGILFEILPSKLCGSKIFAQTNSAQVKSAVLIAGLFAEGATTYVEKLPTRDHTEILLRQFAGNAERTGESVLRSNLRGTEICVPNDISSAAFLIALALLDGEDITLGNVGVNPRRTGFLRVLQRSGANILLQNRRQVCGEDVADICVQKSNLGPLFADSADVCDAIDELPVLVALALATKGKHLFCNVSELQYKESNRVQALLKTAETLCQKAQFDGENLSIESNGILPQKPGFADFGDHRIAMCQAVLALSVCNGGSVDNGCFDISFPNFLQAAGVAPKRFALVGSEIHSSLSPQLMRHFASVANVCCSYEKVQLTAETSDSKLLSVLQSFDGANVTMPFKTRVAKLFEGPGSVNTVGKFGATSTDGYGIVQSLFAHNVQFQGAPLWIVGAGGAAEACIAELQKYRCQMQVFNRTATRAQALSEKYGLQTCRDPVGVLSFVPECDFEKQLTLPQSAQFVFVAAYHGQSGLAAQAKQRGILCIDGLEMLYHQGALSFALWTGTAVQNNFEEFEKELKSTVVRK